MNTGLPIPSERALHSWKEIASYTGRGVRTIQRYEVKLGFPIRRPAGTPRSAVLAFPHEIDEWLAKSPTKTHDSPPEPLPAKRTPREQLEVVEILYRKAQMQMERALAVGERMRHTQDLVRRMKDCVKTAAEERKELALRAQANRRQLAELRGGGVRLESQFKVVSAP